jgi:hypothetical protein
MSKSSKRNEMVKTIEMAEFSIVLGAYYTLTYLTFRFDDFVPGFISNRLQKPSWVWKLMTLSCTRHRGATSRNCRWSLWHVLFWVHSKRGLRRLTIRRLHRRTHQRYSLRTCRKVLSEVLKNRFMNAECIGWHSLYRNNWSSACRFPSRRGWG